MSCALGWIKFLYVPIFLIMMVFENIFWLILRLQFLLISYSTGQQLSLKKYANVVLLNTSSLLISKDDLLLGY